MNQYGSALGMRFQRALGSDACQALANYCIDSKEVLFEQPLYLQTIYWQNLQLTDCIFFSPYTEMNLETEGT